MIKFRELINLTTKDELKNFFFRRRPNTKFRLIGTSSIFVKIIRSSAIRIGCRDLSLPDYFNKSKSLICFDKLNNNLCFWYCIAYHYIKRYY